MVLLVPAGTISSSMHNKLRFGTLEFVPRSAKEVMHGQGFPSTNVAAILSSHLVSSNIEKLTFLID
ncbi:hypothetical protein H5410_050844 [Solanum commersonii]|uniref:Uncharacterized protein n=1 Tax=Solanum commersonii TaxID=4109 RepID=A0A9J5WWK5_SOLCO|nr:hypothetical protein H5410_050844 [Solanum commersonii]